MNPFDLGQYIWPDSAQGRQPKTPTILDPNNGLNRRPALSVDPMNRVDRAGKFKLPTAGTGVSYVQGQHGTALAFSGSQASGSFSFGLPGVAALSGATSMSVTATFITTSLAVEQVIAAVWGGSPGECQFLFDIGTSGEIIFGPRDGGANAAIYKTANGVIAANTLYTLEAVWTGANNVFLAVNGKQVAITTTVFVSGTVGALGNTTQISGGLLQIGQKNDGGPFTGHIFDVGIRTDKHTTAEAAKLTLDPYGVYTSPDMAMPPLAASSGVTGTGASTQAQNTSTASGTVSVSGAGASTQNPNTSQGVGTVSSAGAGASTQPPNTSTAAGTVLDSGTGASTQQPNISQGAGTTNASGAGASTQNPNISQGVGSVLVSGTGASTQPPNTSAAAGTVISGTSGTGASTQQPTASQGVGSVSVSGAGASAQPPNTSAAAGTVSVSGAGASTQQPNASQGVGSVITGTTGTGANTQAPNTSTAAGTVAVSGAAADIQNKNTSTASGTVSVPGTGASTQAKNTSVGIGIVISGLAGAGASTQNPNTSQGVGTVRNPYSPGCMHESIALSAELSAMIARTATLTPTIERCAQT